MGKFIIKGGKKLEGTINIESAKNSVLPMLAGSLLTDEQVIIKNCPKINDVLTMIKILNKLGTKTVFQDDNLVINPAVNSAVPDEKLSSEMRSSIYLMGALVSKAGKAVISYPGGCNIGVRPIDIHLKALKELNVKITEIKGKIICTTDGVKGREIYLDFPSVGATENVILCSATGDGITEIHNAAKEPEIVDLADFINSMGGKISGAGTDIIVINGVKKLHGTTYKPIADRIELGTYLLAGAITGGNIRFNNANGKNICPLIHKLCNNTCKITTKNGIMEMQSEKMRKCFSFSTGPHPFFPTDLQAQTTALLTVSKGVSIVTENVFETRFNHVSELVKMGADIVVRDKNLIINGVEKLSGGRVTACDLRGGAALVLAGLNASDITLVNDIYHIDRGYVSMENKLASLGADIKRI